jgi:hypothetical protein
MLLMATNCAPRNFGAEPATGDARAEWVSLQKRCNDGRFWPTLLKRIVVIRWLSQSLSVTEPGSSGGLSMSTHLELEKTQQHVARLRRRIKNQTRYINVLGDYPDIAKRASDALARDSEELRCALIQLEDLQRQAQQEMGRTDTPTDSNSNVA